MNRSYLRRNFWPLRESTDLHDVNLQFRLGECGASFALSGRSWRCCANLLPPTIIKAGCKDADIINRAQKASASKRQRQQPANDIDRVRSLTSGVPRVALARMFHAADWASLPRLITVERPLHHEG